MSNEVVPESVAIIGMAGRFPQAATLDEFWSNLRHGREAITVFDAKDSEWLPIERPSSGDESRWVRARAVLERAEWFDPGFFHFTPREAAIMDPQQRVFLESAWEALENAGCDPQTFDGAIGVFAGSGFNTYLFSNLLTNGTLLADYGLFPALTLNDKDYLATRVAYKLDLHGPCLAIQTACSTSLVAVAVACQNLLSYSCDLALAGGVSIPFPLNRPQEHVEGGILSKDGHCRAFDAQATGTVAGAGAGVVVLKRLRESLASGDRICAVIRGSAINNDGAAKIGFTAPGIDGQAECIALAQSAAGVEPESISYIEAHGTGTALGDPIEMAALAKAFGPVRGREHTCGVGSVKTNIGHLDAAAGVAGLIKTTLALQHGEIPPTLHFQALNPRIELSHGPFYVVDRLQRWTRGDTPRRAGVSSFGIGGTNAHVVLEEAPLLPPSGPSRSMQLLVLSARTPAALERATENLASHLEAHPGAILPDVAYTLQTGRRRFEHRRAVVVSGVADAVGALRSKPAGRLVQGGPAETGGKTVFMFPGQGAQTVNMGRELYHADPEFRALVDQGAEAVLPRIGLDLRSVLFPSEPVLTTADASRLLARTRVTQPAVFIIEYALARLWMRWGIMPDAMIGHSLGEYVAACLAGVFSFEEGLGIVAERAQLVDAQPTGAMLAVRLPEQAVLPLLGDRLALAAVNAPGTVVVSGPFDAIAGLEARLRTDEVASRRLTTSHAFHSAMVEPVTAPFATYLQRLTLKAPRMRWISNVTGTWISPQQATDPAYWTTQLRQTVRFADGVAELARAGHRILLEVGPGRTLASLARQHPALARQPVVIASSLETDHQPPGETSALLRALGQLWVAGVRPSWRNGLHAGERRRIVELPGYPFERIRCWIEPGKAAATASTAPAVSNAPADPGVAAVSGNGQGVAVVTEAAPGVSAIADIFLELSGLDLTHEADRTFNELGFDSLFLAQASAAVARRFQLTIPFRLLRDELCTLRTLAAYVIAHAPSPTPAREPAAARTKGKAGMSTRLPLTDAQREIWVVSQLGAGASGAYVESATLELAGPLDVKVLQRALDALVGRHEALRTTFSAEGDVQIVASERVCPLSHQDCTGEAPAGAATLPRLDGTACEPGSSARAAAFLAGELNRPFDLVNGPLFRPALARTGPQTHLLALIVHHIICDGWSLGILLRELGELYSAELEGRAPELNPPPSFRRYAEEHLHPSPEAERAARAYWTEHFADQVPVVELPADRPRPPSRTYAGDVASITLSPALTRALKAYCVTHESTLFTALLSAFTVLVHRLTGLKEVVIGVPAAAQALDGAPDLVGHFANLLPIRSRLETDERFADHLAQTHRRVTGALEHWRYPFARLLQQLKLPRDASRVPLTPVLFNTNHFRGKLAFGNLTTTPTLPPKHLVNFDTAFNLAAIGESLILGCYYSTELFDRATVRRWLGHFETLLEAVARDSREAVVALPILRPEERHRILVEWNDARIAYDREAVISSLFEAQAARTPDAVALVAGEMRITYRELDARAGRVARRLRAAGVGPDALVGVCLRRTPLLVAAILGVLKAGGAYVPLDPAYPADRLSHMVSDARLSLVVAERSVLSHLPAGGYGRILADEEPPPNAAAPQAAAGDPPARTVPSNRAYVIYTSGSTGRPKGVAVPQRAVVALVAWARQCFHAGELDGVLFATSASFDVSVFEMFCPLCLGGKIILAENLLELANLRARDEIRLLSGVPSVVAEVVRARALPGAVATVVLAGEPLRQPLVDALFALPSVRRVCNVYGPTETTVYSTGCDCEPHAPPTIGRPLPNEQVYLLDEQLEVVPVGVAGEIYIGGDKVALGYLNQPELTATRFVPDPFASRRDGAPRMYRTGDLARWRPDGTLEILGRRDHQVKVRGFRIELGEIESVLARQAAVAECCVMARPDASGANRLLAYVVPRDASSAEPERLREHLQRELPDYMLPAAITLLPSLPRTASGKIDRAAMPEPKFASRGGPETRAATEIEQVISTVWSEILGVPQIGLHDNFFMSGGDSLHAMQVITRLREVFSIDLTWVHFFAEPTVCGLAGKVEAALIHAIQKDHPAGREAADVPAASP